MRFMVLLKDNGAGKAPSEELLTRMGKFNEELVNAGVMLAGEGLHPSAKGSLVKFSGGNVSVTDGPFAESKELIAGFWILKVDSREEAVEWVKRVPMDAETETEIEVRQVLEAEDFGEAFTPELREAEEQLRARVAENQ